MPYSLSNKSIPQETTIFTIMSTLALQNNAINLSQGFPDFEIDNRLGNLLFEATNSGYNQYAPMIGLSMLREEISRDFYKRYNLSIDPEREITICPGATYAIYTALSAILSKGDEAIVLEPAYDSYIPNIEANGAVTVKVMLDPITFKPDWQKISDAITPNTKAIIINTPHNPTGTVWGHDDFTSLVEIIKHTNISIVSDEVYEQLAYEANHISILNYEELRNRSFVVYSFGKVFQSTGWKIGYCIAPPPLTAYFRKLHQFIAFSVNTPAQYAVAKYLAQHHDNNLVNKTLKSKRDYFYNQILETPFKPLQKSQGSYFQLVSYEGLSELPDFSFAQYLTEKYKVATIPVSAFYSNRFDQKLLRFCFAKKETTF